MAHDVFVSYSSKDKTASDAVVAMLEARGIRCWVAPRDIVPGHDWGESIIEAIGHTRVMVLVFSQHANESLQVKREVERAVAKGCAIVPFRIEAVMPVASLEYFLSTPHWLDAYRPPLKQHLGYLADTVSAILTSDGSTLRTPDLSRDGSQSLSGWRRRRVVLVSAALLVLLSLWLITRDTGQHFSGRWNLVAFHRADPDRPTANAKYFAPLLEAALDAKQVEGSLLVNDQNGATMKLIVTDRGQVRASSGKLIFRSQSADAESSVGFSPHGIENEDYSGFGVEPSQRVLGLLTGDVMVGPRDNGDLIGTWSVSPAQRQDGTWLPTLVVTRSGRYTMAFTRTNRGTILTDKQRAALDSSAWIFGGSYRFERGRLSMPDYLDGDRTVWERD